MQHSLAPPTHLVLQIKPSVVREIPPLLVPIAVRYGELSSHVVFYLNRRLAHSTIHHAGHYWVHFAAREIRSRYFEGVYSNGSIQNAIRKLMAAGLVLRRRSIPGYPQDHRNFYALDYACLASTLTLPLEVVNVRLA